jgi:TatA/E family protein of Tat protein translocase
MHISISKLLLIFAIIVVLFGAKKLRNFGEDFGEALKGFRKAMAEPEDLPPTTSPAAPCQREDGLGPLPIASPQPFMVFRENVDQLGKLGIDKV